MKKLVLVLLIPFQVAFGQNDVPLDSCYSWARANYPNLKQSELWQQITSLKHENLDASYLPRVSLNGQVTYQSEVTKFPIEMPGISVPTVSKDRYNAYAELQQTIWDGGISSANKTLEDAILKSKLSQLEVELYKLNEQVAQAFFTALIVDQQKAVLIAQTTTLNKRLINIESGIRNGAIEKSSALVLQAEILNLEQNKVQLDAAKNASIQMLSILAGIPLNANTRLIYSPADANFDSNFLRPELQHLANQQNQLGTQQGLLGKSRNPHLYGFGKVGYGKPGLNMLLNEFKGYYLFGVGVSWNAFDWKNTSRQQEIIKVQQKILENQEATFIQNLQLLLAQQKEQIVKLETMIENDRKMVALRTDITKAAASKLENEIITASDYIQELQAETVSKLNFELRKIQLNEAQEKYNLIKGK